MPEWQHWVEIKGKPPTSEERRKARTLARTTHRPVTILWGPIPDPHAPLWGECTDIYGGEMNLIALWVIEYGVKAVERAFTAGRFARFR